MADVPGSSRDGYYSPWRIRKLLPDLPLLELGIWPASEHDPDEARVRGKRPHGWAAENALNVAADLKNALKSLDSFTRMIVIRAYVQPDPNARDRDRRWAHSDSHVATILRCDPQTVKRHRLDGVDQMARHLGWEPKPDAQVRRRSETVYRNPRLAGDD